MRLSDAIGGLEMHRLCAQIATSILQREPEVGGQGLSKHRLDGRAVQNLPGGICGRRSVATSFVR